MHPDAIPRTLLDGLADPPGADQGDRPPGRLQHAHRDPRGRDRASARPSCRAHPRTGDRHRDRDAIDTARQQATALLGSAVPPARRSGPGRHGGHCSRISKPSASHASPETDTETSADLNWTGLFLEQGQGHPGLRDPVIPASTHQSAPAPGLATSPTFWLPVTTSPSPTAEAGDLSRAIPMLEQSLADYRRVLGDDHPGTLAPRNNLARAYKKAGDLSRAIPILEQSLTDISRVLGDDHPRTMTAAQQPRPRPHGGGKPGPGHPAVRAKPRRPPAGCWARTTRAPLPPATTSPAPTRRRGIWTGPSRCSSRVSPTGSGSGQDHPTR